MFVSSALPDRVQEHQVEIVKGIYPFFVRTMGMARIIYCTPEHADAVEKTCNNLEGNLFVYRNHCTKTELHHNRPEHLHIVTDPTRMRGFDYRAPGVGFGLLLLRSFNSKRAYRQAIGRAGRMGDEAVWMKVPSVGKGYPRMVIR